MAAPKAVQDLAFGTALGALVQVLFDKRVISRQEAERIVRAL